MLTERAFDGATLLGAAAEKSMLYEWLSRRGVRLEPRVGFQSELRYTEYGPAFAERLAVEYLVEDRAFSKTFRDSSAGADRQQIDIIEDDLVGELRQRRFLLVANNDYQGRLAILPTCTRLPPISHGLNEYADHTTIVFLAALNRQPKHNRMLNALGIGNDVIRRSTSFEVLHQCLMRTSLRNPDSQERVRVIVADRFMADFLVHLFGGVEVGKIGSMTSTKRVPLTPTEKKRRRWFNESIDELSRGQDSVPSPITVISDGSHSRSGSHPGETGPNGRMLSLTLTASVHAKAADEFKQHRLPVLKLVRLLKIAAERVVDGKETQPLFNLVQFDPSSDPGGFRRQANAGRSRSATLILAARITRTNSA
jgi:hypothetical protein